MLASLQRVYIAVHERVKRPRHVGKRADERHGLVRRYRLATAKGRARAIGRDALVQVVEDMVPALQRVAAGGREEWDGPNHVGRMSEDAADAALVVEVASDSYQPIARGPIRTESGNLSVAMSR
nr:hypothetical protein [Methylibium rhizosphaerae]